MKRFFILLIIFSINISASANEIMVFAATSLTESLTTLAKNFEKDHKVKVKLTFDSSAKLARQIHEGAKADIFFSADKEWMTDLGSKKFILPENSTDLLTNELALITHKSSILVATDLKALLKMKFQILCIAQSSVPAGKYAYEALEKAGVLTEVHTKIINADNVRNVLRWVSQDEADMGIVFVTDAKIDPKVKILYQIPSSMHSPIIYSISLLGSTPSKVAKDFYEHVKSTAGQKVFMDAGFKKIN